MLELTNEQAARKVDLTQQITNRLTHGFEIAVEDRIEAQELGIDVEYIAEVVGACYEADPE